MIFSNKIVVVILKENVVVVVFAFEMLFLTIYHSMNDLYNQIIID